MKIPSKYLNSKNVVVIVRYAVYTKSVLQANKVAAILLKRDMSIGIPCMGKMVIKGKTFYWCRYGFLNDPDIYAKSKLKSKK